MLSVLPWRIPRSGLFRVLACFAMLLPATAAGAAYEPLSPGDLRIYREAFDAAGAGRTGRALEIARAAANPLPGKLLRWRYLSAAGSGASFAEIAGFVRQNPDWPGLGTLRLRAESAMRDDLPPQTVAAWFRDNPPATLHGYERFARALEALGLPDEATAAIREAWIGADFSHRQGRRQRLAFYGRHRDRLRVEDHRTRIHRLLWTGEPVEALVILDLLGPDEEAMTHAWAVLLRRGSSNREIRAALDRVPRELRREPGLLFALVRWHTRGDRDDEARAILLDPPADLVEPAQWWRWAGRQTRRALDAGDAALAYRLATAHGATAGADFADATFLAGWIALRFLGQPSIALQHFETLYAGVAFPVSRSRAAYWAGQASEAQGRPDWAESWYRLAALHPSTYYGQLAAASVIGAVAAPSLSEPGVADRVLHDSSELAGIIRHMDEIGVEDYRYTFLTHAFGNAGTAAARLMITRLAADQGLRRIAVAVSKLALQEGDPMIVQGWPLLGLPPDEAEYPDGYDPEEALVHAIIRQESLFNEEAVSHAGARGLMQLMPRTAQLTARRLGIRYSRARLTQDADYNVRLGRRYIASMLSEFDGSYPMAIAAYNAGPHRVSQWVASRGDPRRPGVDIVDWIERIPFNETRNYVQRVLENLAMYRWLSGAAELRPDSVTVLFAALPDATRIVAEADNGVGGPFVPASPVRIPARPPVQARAPMLPPASPCREGQTVPAGGVC